MAAEQLQHQKSPVDLRIVVYRFVKQIAVLALCGLAVKLTLLDTVAIRTDQMMPTLGDGDRALFSRTAYAAPLSWFARSRRHAPVVFRHPQDGDGMGCLRIAGLPGDIVSISNGSLSVLNEPLVPHLGKDDSTETLPADYSPRDWLDPFYLPKPGDTFRLDTLALRDFIFLWAVIRQENPSAKYALQPWLHIDDSLFNDYFITEFSLYQGPFSAIPDELANRWFFWNRLQQYLADAMPEKEVRLTFSVLRGGSAVTSYRVRRPYYFLVADNWRDGFDSRYFGPIARPLIKGTVVCILWSIDPERGILSGIRGERTCRMVH